jgi:hypothetical protein
MHATQERLQEFVKIVIALRAAQQAGLDEIFKDRLTAAALGLQQGAGIFGDSRVVLLHQELGKPLKSFDLSAHAHRKGTFAAERHFAAFIPGNLDELDNRGAMTA